MRGEEGVSARVTLRLSAGGLVGEALRRGQCVKPLQLVNGPFHTSGRGVNVWEGRLHSFDRQSGAHAWRTTSLPLEQTPRRSNRALLPMSLTSLSPGPTSAK